MPVVYNEFITNNKKKCVLPTYNAGGVYLQELLAINSFRSCLRSVPIEITHSNQRYGLEWCMSQTIYTFIWLGCVVWERYATISKRLSDHIEVPPLARPFFRLIVPGRSSAHAPFHTEPPRVMRKEADDILQLKLLTAEQTPLMHHMCSVVELNPATV